MRMLLGICLLGLGLVAVADEEEWELVFPEAYPDLHDLPFNGIGCIYDPVPQYMIGSDSGFMLFSSNSSKSTLDWQPFKLPVPFDITAVTGSGGRWIIGGDDGRIAVHTPGPGEQRFFTSELDPYIGIIHTRINNWQQWLVTNWEIRSTGATGPIIGLAEAGGNLIALQDGGKIFRSADSGFNWSPLDLAIPITDIEVLDNTFYALGTGRKRDPLPLPDEQIVLFRSLDGLNWETVWELSNSAPYLFPAKLMLLSESFSVEGHPAKSGNRLYVSVTGTGSGVQDYWEGLLSSGDGDVWVDHGSYFQFRGVGDHGPLRRQAWNPLELDDAYLNFPSPGILGLAAGNVGILNMNTVEQYLFGDWETSLQSAPWQRFQAWQISAWGELAFLYYDGPGQVAHRLFSIDDSGVLHERPLPDAGDGYGTWRKLEVYEGRHVVMASPHTSIGRLIFESENLTDWTDISLPEDTWTSHLVGADSNLYAVRNGVRLFDGFWSDAVPLPNRSQDVVYNQARGALVSYGEWDGIAHLQHLEPDGAATLITEYQRDPGITTFKKLYCPDGSLLVVVWEDARVFLIDMENQLQALNLQGEFPEQNAEIENITYANGWYYIFGPSTLRTQNWTTFEKFNTPNDERLVHVVAFRESLYAFSTGALYRQPLETGYLGSTEPQPDWHHADWLGWFQIIDKELGDIDHLLLGECWVKQTSEREYWIRTEPLGWIWMNKDWSPWLYRLDDGHWYWLDQDGWPPRAWDDTVKAWVELRP